MKRTFKGIMVHMKNKPSERPCNCCPTGQHTFSRFVIAEGKVLDEQLDKYIRANAPEGAEIIVTVEING